MTSSASALRFCSVCDDLLESDCLVDLCARCFGDSKIRNLHRPSVEPPSVDEPCPHPPGSKAKIEWLAKRAGKQQLFNAGDCDMESARPGEVAPRADVPLERPLLRLRGVERDKFGRWRLRPYIDGKKLKLDVREANFKSEYEACQAACVFWLARSGLFFELGDAAWAKVKERKGFDGSVLPFTVEPARPWRFNRSRTWVSPLRLPSRRRRQWKADGPTLFDDFGIWRRRKAA